MPHKKFDVTVSAFLVLFLLVTIGAALKSCFWSETKVDWGSFKHDPDRLANPMKVTMEVTTTPPQVDVWYQLGWQPTWVYEVKRDGYTGRSIHYRLDVGGTSPDGVYAGRSPLSIPVTDKGFSYVRLRFQHPDGTWMCEFDGVPEVVSVVFSNRPHLTVRGAHQLEK